MLERDNQRGDSARTKLVYRVELAGVTPAPAGSPLPLVTKKPVLDLLPALRAGGGAVPDKPEGLAVAGRELIVAVDNDGLDNAPGESILLRLGRAPRP